MRLIIKNMDETGISDSSAKASEAIKSPRSSRRPSSLRLLQSSDFARSLDASVEELTEAFLQILSGARPFVPRVQVRENIDSLVVNAALPGIDDESLEVAFQGKVLRINGVMTRRHEEVRRKYRREQKVYRMFARVIPLFGEFDRDRAVAVFSRETLRVFVPKTMGARATVTSIAPGIAAE
jgi:HSP20 family molecular chaperone IbpA